MNDIPEHHRRYALAWSLYDDDLPDGAKAVLEREMDSAQNDFTWDEFQAFKDTLPGYKEHWQKIARSLLG